MATKDELKVMFSTGKKPSGDDFSALIEGVVGPRGPAGPAGPAGPKGDTGAAGAAGPKGDKGDAGAAGPAGPKGDKGDAGAAGAKGDKGDSGLGVKSIALTVTDGVVTGGTMTRTDNSTAPITITTA